MSLLPVKELKPGQRQSGVFIEECLPCGEHAVMAIGETTTDATKNLEREIASQLEEHSVVHSV